MQPDEEPRFKFPPPSKVFNVNKVAESNIKVPVGFENILPVVTLDQEFLSIVITAYGKGLGTGNQVRFPAYAFLCHIHPT